MRDYHYCEFYTEKCSCRNIYKSRIKIVYKKDVHGISTILPRIQSYEFDGEIPCLADLITTKAGICAKTIYFGSTQFNYTNGAYKSKNKFYKKITFKNDVWKMYSSSNKTG